jgi:hypothetical protein
MTTNKQFFFVMVIVTLVVVANLPCVLMVPLQLLFLAQLQVQTPLLLEQLQENWYPSFILSILPDLKG